MAVDMNYGIDFRGGSSIEVKAMQGDADVGAVRAALERTEPRRRAGAGIRLPAELLIRIGAQDGGDNAEQSALDQGADRRLKDDYEFRRIEVVGPTVSSELAWAGTIAVLASHAGDADLHLVPVRMAVRRGRDHLARCTT